MDELTPNASPGGDDDAIPAHELSTKTAGDSTSDMRTSDDFGLVKQAYYISCPAGECCISEDQENGFVAMISPTFNKETGELTVRTDRVWQYDGETESFSSVFRAEGAEIPGKSSVKCPLLCSNFVSNYSSGLKETWVAIKCPQTVELLSLDVNPSYDGERGDGRESPVNFVPRLSVPFSQRDVSLFWICDGPSFVVIEKDSQPTTPKDSQWMHASCECWIKKEFSESETSWSYYTCKLQFTTAFSASIANIRLLNFLSPVFVKKEPSQYGITILGPLKMEDGSFVFGKLVSFGVDVTDNRGDITKIFWSIPNELVGQITSVAYCWDSAQESVSTCKQGCLSLSAPLRMLFGLSDGQVKMYSGGIPLLSEKLTFAPNTVKFVGPSSESNAVILAESYRKGCLLRWETMLLSSKQFISDPACIQVNEFCQSSPGKYYVAALPWQNSDIPDPCWKLHDALSDETHKVPSVGIDRLCDIVKGSVNSADSTLAAKHAELESIQSSIDNSLRIIEKISRDLPSFPAAKETRDTQSSRAYLDFLVENVALSQDVSGASFPIALSDGSRCKVNITGVNDSGNMAMIRVEGKGESERAALVEPLQELANQLCQGKSKAKVRKLPFSNERKTLLWSALRKLEMIATALENVAASDESDMVGFIREVISLTAQLDLDLHEIYSDEIL